MAHKKKKRAPLDNLTKGLLLAFAVVGILLAVLIGKLAYQLVSGWTLTSLPGAPVAPTTDPNATAVTVQNFSGDASSKPWDGKSRVNILLLGLDYSQERANRANPEDGKLTDTMILVTIDPMSQTIGAISIRRDLWVEIPHGYGYDKINTAYRDGLASNQPGITGPGLAEETVENLLGVDINYYAIVNLDTFVKLIDDIKGVKITIAAPMLLDWEGNGKNFWIQPGTYTIPGRYALAYARCRTEPNDQSINCGDDQGDIGRGARQMQVIKAIRDRIIDFNMLPTLIAQAPTIYQDVSAGVQTDMTLDQAIQLATLMIKIPKENMTTYNIDYTMVEPQNIVHNGVYYSVLVPVPEKIRVLRDQMFSAGSAAAPYAVGSNDTLTLALKENARIQVLNGTMTGDLADRTAAKLKAQGLNVVSTGNTDATTYTKLVITGTAPYTLAYLQSLMSVSSNSIVYHFDPAAEVDIIVYLGDDWVNNPALTQ
jgi:polyisoprenyl-teichoic acid--peptidoglycan teichoic acid transferase